MGQPSNGVNNITGVAKIDRSNMVEVFEQQTYIYTTSGNTDLHCNGCGNLFKKGQRITYLLTTSGILHFHEGKCLKGVDIQDANVT